MYQVASRHKSKIEKLKNQRLWVWLWIQILTFFDRVASSIFWTWMHQLFGAASMTKNRISDSIFWVIWLADSMPQECPSVTSPSATWQKSAMWCTEHCRSSLCCMSSCCFFFSIPWQATFAADYSNVFCKQEKPIESQQEIAILKNVNYVRVCEGFRWESSLRSNVICSQMQWNDDEKRR
jgi:hypothetical protein